MKEGNVGGDDNPFVDFTDADLTAALFGAIRLIGVLAVVAMPGIWLVSGWQSACLFLVGASLSAAGVYESHRLIGVINAKLDNRKSSRSTGLVVALFFLRLAVAGGVLYASLRCLHGSIYALIAGLCLAMVALSFEAVKLTRN